MIHCSHMKKLITVVFATFLLFGLFHDPFFVVAKETCYVEEDANDGDGSEDEPFEDIEEALDEDCDEIIVKKGTYKENITINRSTTVRGKSKDDVVITGKVIMRDDSKLKDLTVSAYGGVEVEDDADVRIENVKIKKASTGIETSGRGKLVVKDSAIYSNGKGMYIQTGKDVDITDCAVYDNDEEGIDIRANVDGQISGNDIYNNGESGIEVILGKSELTISDNTIKKNGASGIAAQYYKSTSKIGAVKIKKNTLKSNKDYGINCKAPSGGNPGVDYWSQSISMSSNKVQDNKDGDFSSECSFSEEKVSDATKTKKQKEEEERAAQLAAEQAAQKKAAEQKALAEHELAAEELKAEEERKRKEQEKARIQLQKEKDLQSAVNERFARTTEINESNETAREKAESRWSFVMFLIGPRYKELEMIEGSLAEYDQKIIEAKEVRNEITDEEISARVDAQIAQMESEKNSMQSFVQNQKDEFSLFGWIFNRKNSKSL